MKHLTIGPRSFLNPRTPNNSDNRNRNSTHSKNSSWYDRKYIGYELAEISEPQNGFSEENLTFSILNESFTVSNRLYDIVDEIIDSKFLLELEDGWDFENARAVNPDLYLKSIQFLVLYSSHILNVHGTVIQAPEINLIPSGSIDLSWRTEGARMLINIKQNKGEYIGTFYGYHKSNNLPSEGFIDLVKVDESKAVWMKKLK